MSRGTQVSDPGSLIDFAYGTITRYGQAFQPVLLSIRFVTSRQDRVPARSDPTTPDNQRSRALTVIWFGLFPFRSPLLRESLLLSLPEGT